MTALDTLAPRVRPGNGLSGASTVEVWRRVASGQGVVVFVPVLGAGRMPAEASAGFVVPPAVPVPLPIAGAVPGSAGPVPPVPAPPRPAPGVPAPFMPVALVPAAGLAVWAMAAPPITRKAAATAMRRDVFGMVSLLPRGAPTPGVTRRCVYPAGINRHDRCWFRFVKAGQQAEAFARAMDHDRVGRAAARKGDTMNEHPDVTVILSHPGVKRTGSSVARRIVPMPLMSGPHRTAFLRAWEAFFAWEDGTPPPVIEFRGEPLSINAVCTKLWASTNPLPADLAEIIAKNAPFGRPLGNRTYGGGARVLRRLYQVRLEADVPQCEGSP